jgi:hypothetical protein
MKFPHLFLWAAAVEYYSKRPKSDFCSDDSQESLKIRWGNFHIRNYPTIFAHFQFLPVKIGPIHGLQPSAQLRSALGPSFSVLHRSADRRPGPAAALIRFQSAFRFRTEVMVSCRFCAGFAKSAPGTGFENRNVTKMVG